MTKRHTIQEALPTIDSYVDEDGDIRPVDDNPEGFDAVGYIPKGKLENPENAVEGEWYHPEIEAPEGEQLGVYVNLGERATHLLTAIEAFNHASMLQGLLNSKNRKKILEYGGEMVIRRLITKSNERGRRALRVGSGIDAMLRQPDMVPDQDGFPYDEGQATNDMIDLHRLVRNAVTADGIKREEGDSAKTLVEKHKAVERNRDRIRKQLAHQVVSHTIQDETTQS